MKTFGSKMQSGSKAGAKLASPKFRADGVVRKSDGTVRVDGKPEDMAPRVKMMLTRAEREALGLWGGDLARDADGLKKIEIEGDKLTALEALRALTEVSIDGHMLQVKPRVDVPKGGSIRIRRT